MNIPINETTSTLTDRTETVSTSSKQNYVIEPCWHTQKQWRRQQIPTEIKSWLFDPSSLTLRLQQRCKSEFRVQVFKQAWQKPLQDEARRLQQPLGQYAFVRQVHLFCDGQAVVYARTVIPRTSLLGKVRHLATLGQRSLGAVLFSDKSLRRSDIEACRIAEQHKLHRNALHLSHYDNNQPADDIWARRSVFTLQQKPLLVSELFLPAIRYTEY